jgi:hypothetical protein
MNGSVFGAANLWLFWWNVYGLWVMRKVWVIPANQPGFCEILWDKRVYGLIGVWFIRGLTVFHFYSTIVITFIVGRGIICMQPELTLWKLSMVNQRQSVTHPQHKPLHFIVYGKVHGAWYMFWFWPQHHFSHLQTRQEVSSHNLNFT